MTRKNLFGYLIGAALGLEVLVALSSGCGKEKPPFATATAINGSDYASIPLISNEGKEIVSELNWSMVTKENNPFTVDMNGDGTSDKVIMQGNVLYFSKGFSNGAFADWKPIARVNSSVAAYSIQVNTNFNNLPSLLYFDPEGKGRFQINSGTNTTGDPILVDPETGKTTSTFDY